MWYTILFVFFFQCNVLNCGRSRLLCGCRRDGRPSWGCVGNMVKWVTAILGCSALVWQVCRLCCCLWCCVGLDNVDGNFVGGYILMVCMIFVMRILFGWLFWEDGRWMSFYIRYLLMRLLVKIKVSMWRYLYMFNLLIEVRIVQLKECGVIQVIWQLSILEVGHWRHVHLLYYHYICCMEGWMNHLYNMLLIVGEGMGTEHGGVVPLFGESMY